MPSCAVSCCRNSTNTRLSPVTHASPRFHSFPRGPGQGALAQQWLNLCKRSDHVNLQKAVICSDHFLESDYERNLQAELLNLDTPRRLKKGAVPTLYLPKTVGLKGATTAQEIKEPSKGEASRMKRIETRDRKKLVESLIKNSTTEDNSSAEKPSGQKQMNREKPHPRSNVSQTSSTAQETLVHCINLNGRCIFCLDTHAPIQEHENNLKRNDLQNFTDIWPYIQPNWNDTLIPGYAFLNKRNHNPSEIPPMCSSCQDQIVMVASLLKKISALKLQLKELENEAKAIGVELQNKNSPGNSVEQNYGIYDSRYKSLLVELVKERVSSNVMENTIAFLNHLRGHAVDIHEDNSSSVTMAREISGNQTSKLTKRIQEVTESLPKPAPSPRNSLLSKTSGNARTPNQGLSASAIYFSQNAKKCPTAKTSPALARPYNIKVNILASNATIAENEDSDSVKIEVEPKLEAELNGNEDETDHFMNMNMDTCISDPLSPVNDEEKETPDLIVSREDESMETTQTQTCEVCGVQIPLRHIYEHMHSHVGDLAYKCPNPRCNYTFLCRYSMAFVTHRLNDKTCWKAAATDKGFQNVCEQCSQSNIGGTQQFGLHLKTHETSVKKFLCPLKPCQVGFTLRQSLEYHLHASHDPQVIRKSQKELLQKCVKPTCQDGKHLNPEEMQSHLWKQHQVAGLDVERCKFCHFIFADKEDLIEHVVSHCKRKGGISCDICGGDTLLSSELSLKKHYFMEHGIGRKLVCQRDSCKFSCFTKSGMQKHVVNAHQRKQNCQLYLCKSCPESNFSTRMALVRHIEVEHMNKRLKCSKCEKTFKDAVNLRRHEKTHVPAPKMDKKKRIKIRYKCSSCEKFFSKSATLKLHVKYNHLGMKGDHMCDICGKRYRRTTELRMHKLIHSGARPHECHICGQRFRRIEALKKHLRSKFVHREMEKVDDSMTMTFANNPELLQGMDSLPYQCQICKKGLRYSHTLSKHLVLHEKGKVSANLKSKRKRTRRRLEKDEKTGRYKCSSCEKSFKTSRTLWVHVQYQHLGRPRKVAKGDRICEMCGAQYSTNFALEEHKRIHSGERPHQCHICGYKFRYRGNLWKHLGRAHKEKVEESNLALIGEK